MRNISCLLLLFSCLLLHSQTKMSLQETVELKKKVKLLSEQTKTISSDFTQYKHLDFLSNEIITKGNLVFKAPDLVKWAYVEPFKYSVIFKNESLFVDDDGEKSDINLSSSKLFKQLNHLIINSVKGDMFNDKEFKIDYLKIGANFDIHFKPLNSKIEKYIKEFVILFSSKGEVLQIKMIEPTDDFTKIVFKNRVINKPISDAVFNH